MAAVNLAYVLEGDQVTPVSKENCLSPPIKCWLHSIRTSCSAEDPTPVCLQIQSCWQLPALPLLKAAFVLPAETLWPMNLESLLASPLKHGLLSFIVTGLHKLCSKHSSSVSGAAWSNDPAALCQ